MAAKTTMTARPHRVTLQDVAERAGCSAALVSTVINRSRSSSVASEQLARRIVEAAGELGYRPDFASQSLARRATHTIGLYIEPGIGSSVSYPYESAIIRGIEHVCRLRQYDLLVINLSGSGTHECCLNKFEERRIDGLMLLHVHHDADWVEPLLRRHRNIVSVNYHGNAPMTTVNFDNQAATALSVQHLYDLGHRRIGYLGTVTDGGPGERLRCEGYMQAMGRLGLPVDPRWVFDHSNVRMTLPVDTKMKLEDEAGAAYLHRCGDAHPTALVCFNDRAAIAAARYFKRQGLDVPRDISVIGLDDMELCRQVDPQMTTIRQPLEEMGRNAAELLIATTATSPRPSPMHKAAPQARPPLTAPTLVKRESTAPPRPTSRASAFTLVELLVVVAIIALLIAILLPALSKARAAAQSVACMSNQRQVLLAIGMYAEQSQNRYPPDAVQLPDPNDGNLKYYQWFTKPFVGGLLNTATDKPNYTTVRLFFCPATRYTYSSAGAPLYGGNFGVGYNCNPSARIWRSDYSGKSQFNSNTIRNISRLLMLADVSNGNLTGHNNNYRWIQSYNGASNAADPAFEATSYRHELRANVGFADGHTEGFNAAEPDDYLSGTHQNQGLDAAITAAQVTYIASN